MKRSRPSETDIQQSWTAGGRHTITKTDYNQDVTVAAAHRQQFERKDFLEGFVGNPLSVTPLNSSPASHGRSIKPLPPGLTPLPMPRVPPVLGFLEQDRKYSQRSPDHRQSPVTSIYNGFDEFSTSAISQHSSHASSDKESFERVKAEIDEILSPVSACGDRTNTNFPSFNYPVLQIPPLSSSGLVGPRPAQMEAGPNRVGGRRRAMQDLLRAMASPAKRGVNGRRITSAGAAQCQLCGRTYTEVSNLSKHIRTVHLKLRPFRCHLCPSRFAEKNKLVKHIQSVHEHIRPYKCDLCSSSFSQASDRKRHRLVLHEGRRPYVCEHCGKAFGRRSSLTQHCLRIHKQGKKPSPVQPPIVLHPPVGMPSPIITAPTFAGPSHLSPPHHPA